MINIISRAVVSSRTSGPKKVVDNLIKGLDRIGYPYVVNAALDACPRIWIHDDPVALERISSTQDVFPLVGPNLYVLPSDIPPGLDLSKTLYLHPSPWVTDLWKQQGFTGAPLAAWPVGIDTDAFTASSAEKEHVLIYFKKRAPEELTYAEALMKERTIPYQVVQYGKYQESEYRALLAKARYVLWIGCPESQGLGLEEALASDVPVLAWDSRGSWDAERYPGYAAAGATSVPYFDERCGLIIERKEELAEAIARMEEMRASFSPRAFILENLSLEKQALAFVDLFASRFGLSYEDGLVEERHAPGSWRNARASFRLYQLAKDTAKRILQGTLFH